MKIGVVGIPGKWSSEHLADTFARKTGERLLISLDRVRIDLEQKTFFHNGTNLEDLDALVIKKIAPVYSHHMMDRLEILHFFARRGMRIFSDPEGIAKAINRLTGSLELSAAGIPMPETAVTEDREEALRIVKRFGCAVLKPLFTSKARGMVLIEDGPDAARILDEYRREHPILYIQKKVELSGKDLGIAFLDGQYVATYSRVGKQGDWKTTTASGGHYEAFEPDADIIELARRAQAPFGLSFTTVDVALTADGPLVFEVSAFGGFRGLKETHGIDAAELYADHVLKRLSDE